MFVAFSPVLSLASTVAVVGKLAASAALHFRSHPIASCTHPTRLRAKHCLKLGEMEELRLCSYWHGDTL